MPHGGRRPGSQPRRNPSFGTKKTLPSFLFRNGQKRRKGKASAVPLFIHSKRMLLYGILTYPCRCIGRTRPRLLKTSARPLRDEFGNILFGCLAPTGTSLNRYDCLLLHIIALFLLTSNYNNSFLKVNSYLNVFTYFYVNVISENFTPRLAADRYIP